MEAECKHRDDLTSHSSDTGEDTSIVLYFSLKRIGNYESSEDPSW